MTTRKNRKKFSNIKNKKRNRNRSKSRRRKYKGGLIVPPIPNNLPPFPPSPPPSLFLRPVPITPPLRIVNISPTTPTVPNELNTIVTKQIDLDKVTIKGKLYIVDKKTGFVYKDKPNEEPIGESIGRLKVKDGKTVFTKF